MAPSASRAQSRCRLAAGYGRTSGRGFAGRSARPPRRCPRWRRCQKAVGGVQIEDDLLRRSLVRLQEQRHGQRLDHGSFVGALLGAFLISQVNVVTAFLDVTDAWQPILLGIMIITAAALYSKARQLVLVQ